MVIFVLKIAETHEEQKNNLFQFSTCLIETDALWKKYQEENSPINSIRLFF